MSEGSAVPSGSYKPELGKRTCLERPAIEGDSPVFESASGFLDKIPEYGGTRGTLPEAGRTIFQG